MLRHIVMMKFEDRDKAPELSKKMKEMLENLKNSIRVLKKIEVGLNISTKLSAFDIVLTADFKNEEDLNVYREHPEHVKILEFMKDTVEKTAVVDYIV